MDQVIETTEITLLSDDLSGILHLVLLSRRTMYAICQHLAFLLGILAIAILLTIFRVLTPVTGTLQDILFISCPLPDVGEGGIFGGNRWVYGSLNKSMAGNGQSLKSNNA